MKTATQQTTKNQQTAYKTAKDISVYDEENNLIQLSSLKGKPIVINFWTTWCGYCKVEMPYFDSVYQTEKEEVNFLMLNITADDDEEEAKKYIASQQLTFPVYYDKEGIAAYQYQITGYPVTVFINKDFQICRIHQGAITQEALQKYINEIK